jgi:hypothetical protein
MGKTGLYTGGTLLRETWIAVDDVHGRPSFPIQNKVNSHSAF